MSEEAPRTREPPPDTSAMFSVKVDNIDYGTRKEDLQPIFEKYGKIGDIFIPRDSRTRQSRGFAFVRYLAEADAQAAIAGENGKSLLGREMRLEMAKYGKGDRRAGDAPRREPYRGGDRDYDRRDRGDYRGGYRDDRRGGDYRDDRGYGGRGDYGRDRDAYRRRSRSRSREREYAPRRESPEPARYREDVDARARDYDGAARYRD